MNRLALLTYIMLWVIKGRGIFLTSAIMPVNPCKVCVFVYLYLDGRQNPGVGEGANPSKNNFSSFVRQLVFSWLIQFFGNLNVKRYLFISQTNMQPYVEYI